MTKDEKRKVDKATEQLELFVDEFRDMFEELNPEERQIMVNRLLLGYCRDCWQETHGRICLCTMDSRIE